MRSRSVALLIMLACCGRSKPEEVPVESDHAREQARFDRERRPDKIIAALHIGPGAKVADIGSGVGLLTVHLARAVQPNGLVVATDINKTMLDTMHANLMGSGLEDLVEERVVEADTPGLETGTYDVIVDGDELEDDLETEADSYDAIVVAEVDHLLKDDVAWLREAARSLKPGGRMAITNMLYRRGRSMAAARAANLRLVEESAPDPTHFLAVFTK